MWSPNLYLLQPRDLPNCSKSGNKTIKLHSKTSLDKPKRLFKTVKITTKETKKRFTRTQMKNTACKTVYRVKKKKRD